MRLFGDGKHGHAERIQTFRCQACRTTFTARRNTPLYRLKTPSHQIAMVRISRWPKGWIRSRCRACLRLSTSHHHEPFYPVQPVHAQTLHERFFCHLHLPHLQLDELRTRLRCAKQVLWLWLAIDPCTKILPLLHLGPRTQNMAHLLIHSLRRFLAHDCLPLSTSDGLNLYFYAPLSSFWAVARSGTSRAERAPVAGGGGLDQWPGEKKLLAAQAAAGYTRDAPRDTS